MARNTSFHPQREPLRDDDSLTLEKSRVSGPFKRLNPTSAYFTHSHSDIRFKWSSRNNRKGRHAIVPNPSSAAAASSEPHVQAPLPATHPKSIFHGVWRMLVSYPAWDISFDVAYIFTWGSVLWIINAFFAFLPLIRPSSSFPGEILYAGGITAFIGATLFEIGSVLLMLEAVNENQSGCFGWAIGQKIKGFENELGRSENGSPLQLVPAVDNCQHHHHDQHHFVSTPSSMSTQYEKSDSTRPPRAWSWWPSTHELRTHYIYDIGFLACSFQMFGASIFWIAGFTALPGINNKLSQGALDGVFWFPQLLGGLGFVVSGTLFMIESQTKWWVPAPRVLGWHIGLWNMIGGVGFALCPAFGFSTKSWAQYQSSCSTFWGSWAFMIGSTIQWYESLDKFPVVNA